MSNWFSPAAPSSLFHIAASLFVLFCGAGASALSLRSLRRVCSQSSLPHRSLCTVRVLLLRSSVCSCAFRRIRPRTAFRSFLSCLSAATRSCSFLFAFLFLRGCFLSNIVSSSGVVIRAPPVLDQAHPPAEVDVGQAGRNHRAPLSNWLSPSRSAVPSPFFIYCLGHVRFPPGGLNWF